MRTDLSANLVTEMNSLERKPVSQVTVERFLPDWTAKISGLSGGETEQYAHGHGAAVYPDGNGAGEDIIFRARSGSYASPQNGTLYVARIMATDLDDPTTWDSLWVSTGITGLMYPAWTSNSGAAHGGSLAVAVWDNGGTPTGRVFYIISTGDLRYIDVNLTTGAVTGPTTIASLGTGVQLASMQIGCCKYNEVFALLNQQVEASLAAWHKPIYGSFIRRYYYSAGWQTDNSFHFHQHAEGGLLRDSPDEGSDFGDTSCDGVVTQWTKRFCGGLAVSEIDDDTVLVSLGLTQWRRWGYDTHSQGIASFICHRLTGWWERNWEAAPADFNEDTRLDFDSFTRGLTVEGDNFITWNRMVEPSDYEQAVTAQTIPRVLETVIAKLSADGRQISQYQYLGDPDDLTGATIVAVNHGGVKLLYALGWRSVFESPPAAWLCSVTSPVDLGDYAGSWEQQANNRQGMNLGVSLVDPSIITQAGTVATSGALLRGYHGITGDLVQTGLGYIDLTTPTLQATRDGFSEGAQLNARADKLLQDTRQEYEEVVLPQNTMRIEPSNPVEHVALSRGVWTVAGMAWPTTFFPGSYDALQGQAAWRLLSFPFAQTGGDLRKNLKGTWFKDITWLGMSPMVDGAIEASVRFGDVYNQANFTFKATNGTQMYTTVNRSNGVITTIQWRTGGFGGPVWNTVAQYACMAGLICHAAEVGRKYAFVWEYESNFATSSHTDDTWTKENFDRADYSSHGTGTNRLYLVISDYDNSGNWINKSVAGGITATGLTPGHPADLRMQVLGGTIYCYYRLHSTGTPNQWRFAFSYKAGRFGAGRFGLVGRGHAGIMWNLFQSGTQYLEKCDNVVDFWDIRLSDAVKDQTIEEHLKRYCWRGFTPTEFVSKVDETSRVVNSGVNYSYGLPVDNLTIDFKVSIPASGNEAGVFLRGVSVGSPANNCMKIGVVAHSTPNSATNTINYYAVKRYYAGGVEQAAARAYAPIPVQFSPGVAVPVRVTARGPVYAIWIASNFAGYFLDDTELGLYFGLYASGGNATFSDIYVPELYEVPEFSKAGVNDSMAEAISNVLGKRRIKGVFRYNGALKFSYFQIHDTGLSFQNTLTRSSFQRNDRFYSVVKVEGAGTHAIYTATTLLEKGRRLTVVQNPEIFHREFAYREAVAIANEVAERQIQETFDGLPDLRLEPEDDIEIIVSRQNLAGDWYVDDVSLAFRFSENPEFRMTVGTRQKVAL